MNKLIVAVALCASVLVFAIEATARPGFGGNPAGAEFDMTSRLSHHLDLSADQLEQISAIVNAAQLENAVDRERERQIREEMHGLAENFDAGTAQALADELGEIAGRLAYSRVYTMSQIRTVLTEEQLSELAAMREGMGEHRRGRSASDRDSFLQHEE